MRVGDVVDESYRSTHKDTLLLKIAVVERFIIRYFIQNLVYFIALISRQMLF